MKRPPPWPRLHGPLTNTLARRSAYGLGVAAEIAQVTLTIVHNDDSGAGHFAQYQHWLWLVEAQQRAEAWERAAAVQVLRELRETLRGREVSLTCADWYERADGVSVAIAEIDALLERLA